MTPKNKKTKQESKNEGSKKNLITESSSNKEDMKKVETTVVIPNWEITSPLPPIGKGPFEPTTENCDVVLFWDTFGQSWKVWASSFGSVDIIESATKSIISTITEEGKHIDYVRVIKIRPEPKKENDEKSDK